MALNDPKAVRAEYATEEGLEGRAGVYRWAKGADPHEMLWRVIVEGAPRRVVEAGCGRGELAARMADELGAEVVAIDQSERMIELTRARGIDARVADVQALPFRDAEFDLAVAAWMLYHVPDLDRALSELARVLQPGGRLVAVTNGREHLRELYDLLELEREPLSFGAETAEADLRRHFTRVESHPALGSIDFPDRDAAQGYVDASASLLGNGRRLPPFDGPLRVTRAPYVFVADT